jgi:hypothetical protein
MTKEELSTVWEKVGIPLMVGALSGLGGSYTSLQIASARMEEQFRALDRILELHHTRIAQLENVNTNHTGGPLSEHREFRERITALEANQRQVMHKLKME